MKKNTYSSLFNRLLTDKRNKQSRISRPSSLRVENLEDRQLLSATDLGALAVADSCETAEYSVSRTDSIEPISLNVLNTTAAPSAPCNLTAEKTETGIKLSWDADANATSYTLFYVDSYPHFATSTTNEYEFANLNAGTYTFWVAANGADGTSGYSQVTAVAGKVALDAPTRLAQSVKGTDNVIVSWDAVANADNYVVSWTVDGANYSVQTSETSYSINGLTANSSYDVSVYAIANDYEPSDSASITATTDMEKLSKPVNYGVSEVTSSSIKYDWKPVTNADNYVVTCSLDGVQITAETTETSYTFTGLKPNSEYEVTVTAQADGYYDSNMYVKWVTTSKETLAAPTGLAATVTDSSVKISWTGVSNAASYNVSYSVDGNEKSVVTSDTSYTFDGLTANSEYTFSVVATADNYNNSESASVKATTDKATLAAPTYCAQTAKTESSATIEWNAVANAERYVVSYKLNGAAITETTENTSCTISGLTANSSYDVSVTAQANNYYDSAAYDATATTDKATLAAPTGITQTSTTNSVTLTWNEVADAKEYVVTYVADGETITETTADASYTITGLAANTSYAVNVLARSDSYYDSAAVSVKATTDKATLAAPTDLTQTGATDSSVTIAWTGVEASARYLVSYVLDGEKVSFSTSNTTYTIGGLAANTSYDISVTASSDNCYDSAAADVTATTAKTTLATPTGLQWTNVRTSSTVDLKWDAVTNAEEYVITYTHNGVSSEVVSKDNAFTITGLKDNAQYTFTVAARAEGYEDSPATASIVVKTTFGELDAPTDLKVVSSTARSVTLSWTAPEKASKYLVYYKIGGKVQYDVVDNQTEYTVTGLAPETEYKFYVAAGASGYTGSDPVSITGSTGNTTKLPNTVVTASTGGAGVAWTEVEGAAGYWVQYTSDGGATWSEIEKLDADARSWSLANAETGASYKVRVKAAGDLEVTGNSDWVSVEINAQAPTKRQLAAPASVSVDSFAANKTITWAAVENAERYLVMYKAVGATSWTNVSSKITTNSVALSNLDVNSSYDFRVKAVGDGETYTNSGYKTATYVAESVVAVKLARPAELNVDSFAADKTITWDAVQGAQRYLVQYKASGAAAWTNVSSKITTNSVTLSDLDVDTEYEFRVKAIGDGVSYTNSDFSRAVAYAPAAQEDSEEEIGDDVLDLLASSLI